MSLRITMAKLLKKLRFPVSHTFSSSTVTTNSLPISFSGKRLSHWYQTGEYGWKTNLRDPCLWIVISGHVVLTLGISANTAFAEDVTSETSSANSTGDDLTGLRKIEDGSVASNIHTAKWRVFTDKGRELFLQEKLDDAERLFVAAIQEAKEGFGEQDPHVASACNNLAELYRVKKAFDKAEPLYLEAIKILEESFGPDDVRVAVAVHNLGQFYVGQRMLEKAQVSYEIKRRVLGYGHSECSDTMYQIGMVLYLQGKERDAESIIKESISMLETGGEGESFVCIRRLRFLSQLYLKSNRLDEAEMIQRKILNIMELSKGWYSLDTVIAAESLALTLQKSSETKQSKELLERCLDVRKTLLPGDHIQIGANLLHLARVAKLDYSQHKNLDVSRAKAELDMAKEHLHNSIRIARQCLDKVLKQKDKSKKNSVRGNSRKEAQAAFVILLQSLSTLSSVELAKQELQKIQEGDINLEAQEALLQCIAAYNEFVVHKKSIADSPEIKNEYLSCFKHAQTLLGNKLDERVSES
ncbi:kinesin light chain [Trifolium repens]|nr:kinesin light chain [Trifolium repens]